MQSQQLYTIKQTSIGKTLSDEEANRLALVGSLRELATGTELLLEGAVSDSLLVILQGEAEILKITEAGKLLRIATQGAGAVLGEVGLLASIPYTATVRTISPCVVFVLERQDFERLLVTGDSAAIKLVIEIGRTLGTKWQLLANEVVQLSKEQNDLHKAIKSLQFSSLEELERQRTDLLGRSQHIKSKYLKLQKHLYSLNSNEPPPKKQKGKELTLAFATGTAATLIVIYFLGGFQSIFSLLSRQQNQTPYPYIATEEECQAQPGGTWRNGECFEPVDK